MKKFAVIVAAGSGSRMGSMIPKQFMMLKEKPVLYYTLKMFLDTYPDLQVILVLPSAYMEMGTQIVEVWFDKQRVQLTEGGETRFQSVKNGLQLAEEEAIIFVHDGVRCLVSSDLIRRCYQQAELSGSAIPVIPSRDSVRLVRQDGNEMLEREKVVMVQTPQTFQGKILIPAYQVEYQERFTDEASVAEAFGNRVSLVEGEENNIKITRPVDFWMAEKILDELNIT